MQKISILIALLASVVTVFIARPSLCQTKDIPGLDLSRLDEDERKSFQGIVEEQFCPCGTPRSFAESLQNPKECRVATSLGRFVLERVEQGLPKKEIVRGLLRRIAQYNARYEFDLKGSPTMGAKKGEVVVVVFSDFECPYCRVVAEPLEELADDHKDVTVVYKAYPLNFHQEARAAAAAAFAAHNQGKFWEMHDLIFEHQTELDEESYETFAKKLKLDLSQFNRDRKGKAIKKQIERDIKEGDKANLEGTPTVFINGMLVDDIADLEGALKHAKELR